MEDKAKLLNEFNTLKNSNDKVASFKCVDLLTELQDDTLFDNYMLNHKDRLLKLDPIIMIGKHINYYLYSERLNDALKVLATYQNGAFISMDVEDFLKELDSKLHEALKPHYPKDYSLETLESDLLSNNDDKESKAIKALEESNLRNPDYLHLVKNVLISKTYYKYKILILFVLVEQQITTSFTVKDDESNSFIFSPNTTSLPFDSQVYKELNNYLTNSKSDAQVLNYALEITNIIFVKTFPHYFIDESNYSDYGEIILYLAKKYLGQNPNLDFLISNLTLLSKNYQEEILRLEALIDKN